MDRISGYRKMHALLRELGIEKAKQDMLEGYGVEHTSDLSDIDLNHLVYRLEKMKRQRSDSELKRWRSNVMTLLNKYGVYATNNDWSNVNRFLLQKKICGKVLFELSLQELQALCIKLRVILKKRMAQQDDENELSKLN